MIRLRRTPPMAIAREAGRPRSALAVGGRVLGVIALFAGVAGLVAPAAEAALPVASVAPSGLAAAIATTIGARPGTALPTPRFGPTGSVELSAPGGSWRLAPVGVGRQRPLALSAGPVTVAGARRTQALGPLDAWYVRRGATLEQGFTVPARPSGSGASFSIDLASSGSLVPRLSGPGSLALTDRSATTVLRYSGLSVSDATGRRLPARFALDGDLVKIVVSDAGARYPLTVDPEISTALFGADVAAHDAEGSSVSLSAGGTIAAVGAPNAGDGAVYVFVFANGYWSQAREITDPDADSGARFGAAVALSGDGTTLLVGAPGDSSAKGKAYLYTFSSGSWVGGTLNSPVEATDPAGVAADGFGQAVALSSDGSTALIGAPGTAVGGHAYVYASAGTLEATIADPAAATGDTFGSSVSLSADESTAIVGAPESKVGANAGQGSAYVFVSPAAGAAGWSGTIAAPATLAEAAGAAANDLFGSAVALSGDESTAVVGAPGFSGKGAILTFAKGAGWTGAPPIAGQLADPATGAATGDAFGSSVATSSTGSTLLVGAPARASNAGAAFTSSTPFSSATAVAGTGSGAAGSSVALSADGSSTELVGAPAASPNGESGAGAADASTSAATLVVTCAATTASISGDDAVTLALSGGGETINGAPVSNAGAGNFAGSNCTSAATPAYPTIAAAAATSTLAFSTDSSAPVTFAGNDSATTHNSSLTFTTAGQTVALNDAITGNSTSAATGHSTTTFNGIGGTITGTSTGNTVTLPTPTGTLATTLSAGTVNITDGGTAIGRFDGGTFTVYDGSGTGSHTLTFSTDSSAPVTFLGNDSATTHNSSLTFTTAGQTVALNDAITGNSTSTATGHSTTTFNGIGGTITGTSTGNTVTLPTPTGTLASTLSAGTVTITDGGTAIGRFAGFTTYDGSAETTTLTFSTDSSAPVTFAGNDSATTHNSSLTFTTAGQTVALNDAITGNSTSKATGQYTAYFKGIGGTNSGASTGNTVTLPAPTGTLATTLSAGTVNITDGGTAIGRFDDGTFTVYDGRATATSTLTFSTDSSAPVTFLGNDSATTHNSSLTFTTAGQTVALNDAITGNSTSAATGHSTTTFNGIGGTITGTSTGNTVTLPTPTGTLASTLSAGTVTITDGGTAIGRFDDGTFTTYSGQGTGSHTLTFSTDSSAPVTFLGNDSATTHNSSLTFTTAGQTVALNDAITGNNTSAATGHSTTTFNGIGGTITGTSTGNTVTLPTPTGTLATTLSAGTVNITDGGTAIGRFDGGTFTVYDGSGTGSHTLTFSTDSSAPVTFLGNDSATTHNSSLTFTTAGQTVALNDAITGNSTSTATGHSTTTFNGIGGTITGTSTGNTVTLPTPTGSLATTLSAGTVTITDGGTAIGRFAGFTTYDGSAETTTLTFSTDSSAPVTFAGNDSATTHNSSLTFTTAGQTVALNDAITGNSTSTATGHSTTTFKGIGGTITGTSTGNTVTLPTPTGTLATTLSAGTVNITDGGTAIGRFDDGTFTVYDGRATATSTLTFSTDSSAPVTFLGNDSATTHNSSLTFTTAGQTVALNDAITGNSTSAATGHSTTTFNGIGGTITGTSTGNTVTLPTPTGTLATTLSAGTVNITDGGTAIGRFDDGTFTTYSGQGTGSHTLAFSTDSSAPVTFAGNDSATTHNSSLTFTTAGQTVALNDAITGNSTSAATGHSTTTFNGIGGTITGTSTGNTVTLPTPTGSLATTLSAGTVNITDGGTAIGRFDGGTFTVYDGSGVDPSKTLLFSTDSSRALTFAGNGAKSAVTFTDNAGDVLTLVGTPSAATPDTVTSQGVTTSFYGVSGTITGGAGTNSVSLPSTGGGTVTVTIAAGAVTIGGNVGVGLANFTVVSAPATGNVAYSTDGSVSYVFAGNGDTTTLTFTGTPTGAFSLNANGSGAVVIGALTSSFSNVGTINGSPGLVVTLPTPASGTLTVSVTGHSTAINTTFPVTITNVTVFHATAVATAFITDSTPGYQFVGFNNGTTESTLSFANMSSGQVGATVCLALGTAYFGGGSCGSGATHDTFSNIATVTGGSDNDTFVAASGSWTLIGDGGSDLIDFSGAASGVTVNLGAGTVSGGGYTGTTTLSGFGSVLGSPAADTITGSATVPGALSGGGGNDTFIVTGGMEVVNGGAGTNTLDLGSTLAAVTLDLSTSGFQSTGGAGLLDIIGGTIQTVLGSPFGLTIFGAPTGGTITAAPSSPSDVLNAGSGSYTLNAGNGSDTLIAGSGTVTFNGGSGADLYTPGSGSLTIHAGSGSNGLSFANAPTGVEVNLSNSPVTVSLPDAGIASITLPARSVSGGWGSKVTLSGTITTVLGSAFADVIVGAAGTTIDGGVGADVLVGTGGGVTIKSEGAATIDTGDGANTVTCSAGSDCTLDFEWVRPDTANDGVKVDLSAGTATLCGWAQLNPGQTANCNDTGADTISGITEVIGTTGADQLTASAAHQTLVGLGGTNIDNDRDSLTASSAGFDTLVGGNGGAAFLGNGGGHDTFVGGSGPDTYLAQIFNGTARTTTQAFDVIELGGQNDFIEGDPSDTYSGISAVAPQTLEYITGFSGTTPIESVVTPIP